MNARSVDHRSVFRGDETDDDPGIPTFRSEPRDETRKRNSSQRGTGEAELSLSSLFSTCRPLPGTYHVLSKVTGDTWNWKIVRSPSTSGRCCRDRRRTAGRRRVGISLLTSFPATRRRQHRRPSGSVQPFLNATPLRRPRYLITRFTHSSPISESRGTSPPGRYTRAPAREMHSHRVLRNWRAFFHRLHTSDDARVFVTTARARRDARRPTVLLIFSRVAHRATTTRCRKWCGGVFRPDPSPRLETAHLPLGRDDEGGSPMSWFGARLTGRIPAVSRPSRRMPS